VAVVGRLTHTVSVISGGAGFLGSHLADALYRDDRLVVVDNLSTGHRDNLARHQRRQPPMLFLKRGIEQMNGSPGMLPKITDHFGRYGEDVRVRYVLHFASIPSPIRYQARPIATLRAGAQGTEAMLKLAKQTGARFLLASTSEVYGDPLVHPQPETYRGNVDPVGPRAMYDESKRYAEALTMAYRQEHSVDTGIVRLFNTYGPRMDLRDGRLVPEIIRAARYSLPLYIYGDGLQTRSLSYVSDTVKAIMAVLKSDEWRPVNIGSTDERTVLDIVACAERGCGRTIPVKFAPDPVGADPRRRQPDITRLREILSHRPGGSGWPTVPLEDGFKRTFESVLQPV
jgi:dTDP-glucose 4,6-dehydratase